MAKAHRSRWLGTTLALIALVLGLGAGVGATAPAPAYAGPGSSFEMCFPIFNEEGQIIDWICVPIPVEQDPCPGCPDFAIGFDHLVLPSDPWYLEDLALGLDLLGQASQADPREAAVLRDRAQDAFLSAAERLGENWVRLGEAGFVDLEQNIVRPEPDPWLVLGGADLASGLTLMQEALVNPEPTPWLTAGMAQFDAAFDALANQQPAG
jgi:hypothetical protein